MKKRITFLLLITAILGSGFIYAKSDEFFGATFLSSAEAKKRWGFKEFNPANFKKSSVNDKSAMAADAVQKKAFVGQKMKSVREKMGDPDSYFFF